MPRKTLSSKRQKALSPKPRNTLGPKPRKPLRSLVTSSGKPLPPLPIIMPQLLGHPSFTAVEIATIKAALREKMSWRPFRGGGRRQRHGLPEGVLGLGFGWKRSGRQRTVPNCLRVYVERKGGRIAKRDLVPHEWNGITIDVIEIGAIRRHQGAQSGTSIGDQFGRCGTLGCIVTDGKSKYLLGSWHVMDFQNAGDGSQVYMPAPGSSADFELVGQITASPQITLGSSTPYAFDAAIASIADGVDLDPTLPGLGGIAGTPADLSGSQDDLPAVTIAGCATQGQSGLIEAVAEDVQVMYFNDSTAVGFMTNQIGIVGSNGAFSADTDSGSLVVTQEGRNPVGILVGGGTTTSEIDVPHSFASPIGVVLSHFGVSIVTE
jgi:hypothetical protein